MKWGESMGVPKSEYWLLSLVQVDRGMIPTGAKHRNGEPILGQHIPYYAGLIIQHKENGKQYFLDEFNSEILLRDYLGYSTITHTSPSLNQMINDNQFVMLHNNINLVTVRDLEVYLKTNGIVKKHRNAEAMHQLADNIQTCWPQAWG